MSELALLNCSQLVTVAGPDGIGVIPNGAMLVRDGRIAAVGSRLEIERQMPASAGVVDAYGRVVLPGFVDAHTHTVFAGTRASEFERRTQGVSYAEIAAAGGGIRATVRQTRAASEQELIGNARRYREWFLRGGTTTVEAKSGYGLSLAHELKTLRVVRQLNAEGTVKYVPTFLGAHEIPDEFRGRTADYVSLVVNDMLPTVAAQKLAVYCDIFCEPKVFSIEHARTILSAAQRLGFMIRIHADQFTADYGSPLAAEFRAATADHLEYTSEPMIRALKAAGVTPILLPGSVYALGLNKYPDARMMLRLGLPVVLATDFNPGSSPTASMPMVLSLACTQMHMTPVEAIRAVTINAAHSLGRGSTIGSLEPGKCADFVIHDCTDFHELCYFFGRETASAVYINGKLAHRYD